MRWDIFCKVIDNHGDIGVCWRLAADLAGRGETVRLWVDAPGALAWLAPAGAPGVQVLPWTAPATEAPGDVVVEAFGCELDQVFVAGMASQAKAGRAPAWINLEYLSAEPWAERCHGLPSPVLSGAGQGLVKRFFYPGFTARTGGLLREPDLPARRSRFDRSAWLSAMGIPFAGERVLSLFCYEPPGLTTLLADLAADPRPTRLLVTAGRAAAAVQAWLDRGHPTGTLSIDRLPLVPQREFDHLLWACDLNFVRGEDSIVRALWAGVPAVWNIYPQEDGAHRAKLQAFLDWMDAPPGLRAFHQAWNDGGALPHLDIEGWRPAASAALQRLLQQDDLTTQLMRFVAAG
ncbi:MAG TPA: elongation factor P maturation arginine rhamnosyltransferase EarP [Ramlibacter sp.]|jgi:uncharacterized repeat protein (TIGR03837 family)|uniref:elongation factor P maturation arginine rhamnosyltransferase EarP n=1 Tax=Ramlibacter sp. TaxID=1917967 RepID=UPI002D43B4C5|nr:elongation factor P maturation arginine rhamnosyltransferase EarP [Ramlibacter sp.]HZY19420.1 elongation factor P maturation arginine rhamnosyltransferase EarP [Ramlibacter sp.]